MLTILLVKWIVLLVLTGLPYVTVLGVGSAKWLRFWGLADDWLVHLAFPHEGSPLADALGFPLEGSHDWLTHLAFPHEGCRSSGLVWVRSHRSSAGFQKEACKVFRSRIRTGITLLCCHLLAKASYRASPDSRDGTSPPFDGKSFIVTLQRGIDRERLIGTIWPTLSHSDNGVRRAGGVKGRRGVLRTKQDWGGHLRKLLVGAQQCWDL